MMLRRLEFLLFLLLLASGCGGGEGRSRPRFLSFGTGGTGGIYYPLGGALASLLSAGDSLRQYTAEVTGGSVENVNRLRARQVDLAFALSVTIYQAYGGSGDYEEEPFPDLCVAAPLYPNVVHVLIPSGAPVTSLSELRGRRVAVGSAGSGTEQTAREILDAAGLTYREITPRFLSFSESAIALRDGAIDAAILSVGYPAGAVMEAVATGGARLLPLADGTIGRLRDRHSYYDAGSIPAGVYPGLTHPVATVSMMNWIVARKDLDPVVIERLLDLLSAGRDELVRVHEMAAQIDVGRLGDAPIPLCPATEGWLGRRAEGGGP